MSFEIEVSIPMVPGVRGDDPVLLALRRGQDLERCLGIEALESGAGFGYRDLTFEAKSKRTADLLITRIRQWLKAQGIGLRGENKAHVRVLTHSARYL